MHILAPNVLESIAGMKRGVLQRKYVSLNLEEALIALSVSAAGNPAALMAMERLGALRDCEVHLTHIPTPGDEAGLRRLGVNVTSDPAFPSRDLFMT
jgi:uncharacterized protein (UPF0371 family)